MGVDHASFRAAMARFPGAVTIITACQGEERRGITATAVCSVSADPPSLLVCVNRKTGTCAAIRETRAFNVNLLPDPASPLAMRFAGADGVTGEDKFAKGSWTEDSRGLPLLGEALIGFSCEVSEMIEAGSHTVFIGEIVDIRLSDGAPLVYEQSRFHRLAPL
ncbi:flavin reductase family protein [uncultured Hoeflea sp.]|uniref:flavin reductase family protein n=1 Tax=uncultured Hoeflea sp. TaxID=538666 RepID=UPI0026065260|nr:flavin reductase family protein [uncultured Hoeflea sp.]